MNGGKHATDMRMSHAHWREESAKRGWYASCIFGCAACAYVGRHRA